ncbi:MAG: hypothetical protein HC923_08205, partial [Myxococcales bacterium]|nr:hypothetical protein [Myxococcales bacterium]
RTSSVALATGPRRPVLPPGAFLEALFEGVDDASSDFASKLAERALTAMCTGGGAVGPSVGLLRRGGPADLVVLEGDPRSLESSWKTSVALTIARGRITYERPGTFRRGSP